MVLVWQILVGNFASVALIISAWMHVSYRLYRLSPQQQRLSLGAVLGFSAIASMLLSVQFVPGVYFDLRLALISIAALFGGPLAMLVTAVMAAAFRVVLGGAGMMQGLMGISITSAFGLAVWWLFGRRKEPRLGHILCFGAYVGLLSIAVLALLPRSAFTDELPRVIAPIAILNAIVAAVAGLVITYFQRFTMERDILRAALAQAPDYHYVKNLDHRFVVANLNVAHYNGFERASEMIGLSDLDIEPGERGHALIAQEREILASGKPMIDIEEHVVRDGRARWFTTSKVPLRNRNGDLIGLAGVTIDITDRKRLEQELQASRDIVTQATAAMSDGLALYDPAGYLLFCNQQYRDLFPRSAHARQAGAHIVDILTASVRSGERKAVPVDLSEEGIRAAAATLHQNKDEKIELFDGSWIQLRSRLGKDGSSLIVVSDITAAQESEIGLVQFAEQMRGLAQTDALTGLANRRTFDERLKGELQSATMTGKPLALLMIDVDRFKIFNDTYGHIAGDACLRKVADCLQGSAKRENDLAVRYGGEEFAILLPDTPSAAALAIADQVRQHVSEMNLAHAGSEFGRVTVSIGVAVADDPAGLGNSCLLVEKADQALYRSKEEGRNRIGIDEPVSKPRPRKAARA